jgi:hypothetical protein
MDKKKKKTPAGGAQFVWEVWAVTDVISENIRNIS